MKDHTASRFKFKIVLMSHCANSVFLEIAKGSLHERAKYQIEQRLPCVNTKKRYGLGYHCLLQKHVPVMYTPLRDSTKDCITCDHMLKEITLEYLSFT